MKNVRRKNLAFLFAIFLTIVISGQGKLKTGDQLTGIRFKTVINHPKKTINVDKDFKDKLVIFDSWGWWCYPCVRDLPRLDSLQREFGKRIQILPWTDDPKATAQKIYDRINAKYDMVIPSAVAVNRKKEIGSLDPDVLKKIWWYNGKIVAITKTRDVNAANIQEFLDTGSFTPKEIEHLEINNFKTSLLTENILYEMVGPALRVKITENIPGYLNSTGYTSYSDYPKIRGKRSINTSLPGLYNYAYNTRKYLSDVDSVDFYDYSPKDTDKTYCVEIIADINSIEERREAEDNIKMVLRHALEATFGFTMVREIRKVPTYVLREIPGNNRFKDTSEGEEIWDKTAYYLNIDNLPAERAFHAITSKLYDRKHEVLFSSNELEYTGNISLDITARTNDYKAMKPALAQYGLDLSIEEREKEVWVVKKL